VFFDGARAKAIDVVGGVNNGWKVAMGTLAFERGASTLGQQLAFRNELDTIVAVARANGRIDDPVIRQRLAAAHAGLEVMRWNTLRVLSGPDGADLPREAMITKLFWSNWHRDLGELAMDVVGPDALLAEQDVPPGEQPAGATSSPPSNGCSCSPAPTPSTPGPTRSSATSSASGRWASRPNPRPSPRLPPRTDDRDLSSPLRSRPRPAGRTRPWWSPPRPAPGIGSAVARRAIEEGARVVISDFHERRSARPPTALAEETGTRPVTQVRCNVTSEDDVQALVATAVSGLGGIDVLVNNAGLGGSTPSSST
jgi:hypothetical protein